MEIEKREEQEAEKLKLMRKLCLTGASDSASGKDKNKDRNGKQKKKDRNKDAEDDDIDKLLEDDGFFDAYMKQRMAEMVSRLVASHIAVDDF